jgi:tetraacyldisaccharide 4'-kinase
VSALSAIYGHAARLRRSWYEGRPSARRRLSRPVVSVGNLVVGGSGKTPVVAALARLLRASGERPAILSRGYGRRTRTDGVVVVSDGDCLLVPVETSGDEPRMLAGSLPGVPVMVSPDRYLAGTLAERRFGATVLLLDDGFQHLQLERTIDLLVASRDDLGEKVLPWGRLREPLTAARSAHAVLVYGNDDDAQRLASSLGVAAAFNVVPRYPGLKPLRGDVALHDSGRMVAVAGIARPERFFRALREHGCDVAVQLTFRDHHWFTRADLDRVEAVARDVNARAVVTTEKDAVRIESMLQHATVEWAVFPLEVTIEPHQRFATWLGQRL